MRKGAWGSCVPQWTITWHQARGRRAQRVHMVCASLTPGVHTHCVFYTGEVGKGICVSLSQHTAIHISIYTDGKRMYEQRTEEEEKDSFLWRCECHLCTLFWVSVREKLHRFMNMSVSVDLACWACSIPVYRHGLVSVQRKLPQTGGGVSWSSLLRC